MKGTLKLEDGRELIVELGDEALSHLDVPKKTGYERAYIGEKYYTVLQGKVESFHELEIGKGGLYCLEDYKDANYYSDKTVAENNARADTLMRKLRRFAVEHREENINWDDSNQLKYEIYYDHFDQIIKTYSYQNSQSFGLTYFDTRETAELAIEEFKDELMWYFTKYKDSL